MYRLGRAFGYLVGVTSAVIETAAEVLLSTEPLVALRTGYVDGYDSGRRKVKLRSSKTIYMQGHPATGIEVS